MAAFVCAAGRERTSREQAYESNRSRTLDHHLPRQLAVERTEIAALFRVQFRDELIQPYGRDDSGVPSRGATIRAPLGMMRFASKNYGTKLAVVCLSRAHTTCSRFLVGQPELIIEIRGNSQIRYELMRW